MDLAQVKEFFFKAMMEGWAVGSREINVLNMPGHKAIPLQYGDFFVMDTYCVNPNSGRYAGTTTICYRNVPVWVMNYSGYYKESVIGFLKKVLRDSYSAQRFIGGRGPAIYTEGALVYMNRPHFNSFARFKGREEIINIQLGISCGHLEYSGTSLL